MSPLGGWVKRQPASLLTLSGEVAASNDGAFACLGMVRQELRCAPCWADVPVYDRSLLVLARDYGRGFMLELRSTVREASDV